jgi:hypothetical protein
MRRSFSQTTLMRLREMPSEDALARLATYLKADQSFQPAKDAASRRWQVRTAVGEFEILTTGVKWYDMRAKQGGGGAIDLAMHVLHVPFVIAVQHLMADEHANG